MKMGNNDWPACVVSLWNRDSTTLVIFHRISRETVAEKLALCDYAITMIIHGNGRRQH